MLRNIITYVYIYTAIILYSYYSAVEFDAVKGICIYSCVSIDQITIRVT